MCDVLPKTEFCILLIKVIMLRLQQVTMMALHNFLGLTQELINYVSTKVLVYTGCLKKKYPLLKSDILF